MKARRRSVLVLILATLFAALPVHFNPAAAQTHGPVLDQQTIEIEGMRPVGLSPDGNLLAATTFEEHALCVYRVDPLEEQVCTELEPLEARLRMEDVSWSPDSTRLVMAENVFVLFRDGDLWIMDATTGELTNITDDGYSGNVPFASDIEEEFDLDVSPTWTPDGSGITFARTRWVNGDFLGTQIMSVPATGGEAVELIQLDLSTPGIAYAPMRWSADGQHLYYTVTHPQMDEFRNGVYRYTPATGQISGLVPSDPNLGAPALLQVSPAGDALIGTYPRAIATFESEGHWFYDLETDELTILLPPGGDEELGRIVTTATFSPDGRSILIGVHEPERTATLWEISRDDLSAELLVSDLPGAIVMRHGMTPSWTESGRIFVPANIGIGTLLQVAPSEAPKVTPDADAPPVAEEESPFLPGDTVVINSVGVPLHAAPSELAPAVLLLDEGATLTVIGPAEEADGTVWVPVQDEATRTIGFVRVEFIAD